MPDFASDNTPPVAIALVDLASDNTAPAAVAVASAAPDNTAPVPKTVVVVAPANDAPVARALADFVSDNTAPGVMSAAAFEGDDTAAVARPVGGAVNPITQMASSFVPAFSSIAALIALPTVGLSPTRILQGLIGESLASVQLRAGTPAHDPDSGVYVPTDHDPDTNAVYWALIGGTPIPV